MLAPDVFVINPSGRISHILVIHSADAAFKSNLRLRALNSLLAMAAPGRYEPYWESQGMAQKLWHWDYTLLHARRAKNPIYQALN